VTGAAAAPATYPDRDRTPRVGRAARLPGVPGADDLLDLLLAAPGRRERLTHVAQFAGRDGVSAPWPNWVPDDLRRAWRRIGIETPWAHQVSAAELAWTGGDVVLATGTASGKSLAYLMPTLSATIRSPETRSSTLYLGPTKALAADQWRSIAALEVPGVRVATYDGDTPSEEREWVRSHATFVLTNPDMLHHSMLPGHARWASFLKSLRYVVVDEVHAYRGLFGSHVAAVLRRLQRVAQRYGADPTFILASATVAEPETTAQRLIGREVTAVNDDASPRGAVTFALWEPPLATTYAGEHGAPVRRTATAESADLLTDLVAHGRRVLVFVRSRRGAETVALLARGSLADVDPALPSQVAAYRAGFLPEERRLLERRLKGGQLRGLASTTALELGVDISGLDAVVLAGWPGTRASLWQQAGRAGRDGSGALAVLVARDDPLDTYLVHHPEAIFGAPAEATVLDPDNPYVLAPHLCAAAAELPLTPDDLARFGPSAAELVADLVARGYLRARSSGWYWTRRERATDLADLRGIGGRPVRVVEAGTGRLLGTVDVAAADTTVHRGAVYVHQGDSYLVEQLDLDDGVALVSAAAPEYTTTAREITALDVVQPLASRTFDGIGLHFGTVDVTHQVVSFLRRRFVTGEVLGEEPLDLPPRTLQTRAVWWTFDDATLAAAGVAGIDVPGALHAAEHAAIGLLPLFATCDRWDVGGVSTQLHPDTGQATFFVYDGHPGGAGFAERGYADAGDWLTATRDAILDCTCPSGCPSCIQSPKCGNGNEPLDKPGAIAVLTAFVAAWSAAADQGTDGV
jgi:DEAD/DEAH box helicase domain-containing protein